MNLDALPQLLTANRTVVTTPARRIELIVIHDMEWREHERTAEDCAAYFYREGAKPNSDPTKRKVSAHYNVDVDSIVRSVLDKDVAWAAPGANHNGIQIELAGYARQTVAEWKDPYSTATLAHAAELTAALCKLHNIPVTFLTSVGLKAGLRGITTHAEVSKAFGGTHTDPGPNFPLAAFISLVRIELAKLKPVTRDVTFQVVNNGELLFESLPVMGVGAANERLRLHSFLGNHVRGIHAALAADPDASIQIKRKVAPSA